MGCAGAVTSGAAHPVPGCGGTAGRSSTRPAGSNAPARHGGTCPNVTGRDARLIRGSPGGPATAPWAWRWPTTQSVPWPTAAADPWPPSSPGPSRRYPVADFTAGADLRRPARRGGRPPVFDPAVYRRRNQVERGFTRRKHWRGLAMRFDKLGVNYQAALDLAEPLDRLRAVPTVKSAGPSLEVSALQRRPLGPLRHLLLTVSSRQP